MKSACISALLRMLTASAALLSASDSSAQAPAAQADVQRIVVVMDDAYPPYTFRDAEGDLLGILPDQWRLWEASTGVSVELVATNWAAAQAFMKAGRADVIDTIFKTPERMRLYDFAPPYATLEVPVFAHKDLGGIVDAIRIGRRTLGIIRFNIAFALGLKALFLGLALFGYASLWFAILADTGATFLVVGNALRLLRDE